MNLQFKDEDIARIGTVLGVSAKKMGTVIRFELQKEDLNRKLALEIYPDSAIGKRRGTLVSVYTPTAHLQLHFCTGFVVSEMLGELTFVGEEGGKLSGLTVEREGGCSLYANVDREILSGDFTTLGPEVMMSGIALSLTEQVLPEVGSGKTRKKARTSRSQRAAKRTVR